MIRTIGNFKKAVTILQPKHNHHATIVLRNYSKKWLSSSAAAAEGDEVDVLSRYKAEIRLKNLIFDPHQEKAALKLRRLQKAFLQYNPDGDEHEQHQEDTSEVEHGSKVSTTCPTTTAISTMPQEKRTEVVQYNDEQKREIDKAASEKKRKLVPRGLYIYGEVGCGKSFLMDLFFDSIHVQRKRRVHFHSFMNDIHQRIHKLKQLDLQLYGRNFHVDTEINRNPIYRVAKQISNEVKLLCFDEFQVTDVADALILSQLFTILFQEGTVVVATGNRAPQDLYENGINRSYFLPFISLLERHCIVHPMNGTTDYRAFMAKGVDNFFFIHSEGRANLLAESMFEFLATTGCTDTAAFSTTTELPVTSNRSLKILQAARDKGICRVHFDDMCKTNVGASDYRVLAQTFPTICLEGIPRLSVKDHDFARRFITLVDELYEARCALVCFAESPPEELYKQHPVETTPEYSTADLSDTELTPGELFGIFRSQANGKTVGELASVIELSFAFRRAASRLIEMCSRSYWEKLSHGKRHLSKELLSKIGSSPIL